MSTTKTKRTRTEEDNEKEISKKYTHTYVEDDVDVLFIMYSVYENGGLYYYTCKRSDLPANVNFTDLIDSGPNYQESVGIDLTDEQLRKVEPEEVPMFFAKKTGIIVPCAIDD